MRLVFTALRLARLGAAILVIGSSASVRAQDEPYTEGPVTNIAYIRTEPGQFDNYMAYIFGDYARLMEAYKAEGLILDWGVMTTETRSPDEANVLLTTTYENMAALDGLTERSRPFVQRIMSLAPPQAAEASIRRGAMRRQIGSQLYRAMVPRR